MATSCLLKEEASTSQCFAWMLPTFKLGQSNDRTTQETMGLGSRAIILGVSPGESSDWNTLPSTCASTRQVSSVYSILACALQR